jgi:anti-anti-sigma regulatory factor
MLKSAADRVEFAEGRVVVLDLCDATFVDSSVLHFALGLKRRAEAHGAVFVVVAPRRTKKLFEAVGADELRIVEDAARTVAAGAAS